MLILGQACISVIGFKFHINQSDNSMSKDSFIFNGREFRWMSEDQMQDIGITSCVRKVLAAVKDSCLKREQSTSPRAAKRIKAERQQKIS